MSFQLQLKDFERTCMMGKTMFVKGADMTLIKSMLSSLPCILFPFYFLNGKDIEKVVEEFSLENSSGAKKILFSRLGGVLCSPAICGLRALVVAELCDC